MPANSQDTTYGSDADLLEERGNMWKARAEKAEAEAVRQCHLKHDALDATAAHIAAAVLREREECLGALLALERRRNPGELVTLQDGIAAIRARSK